MEKNGSKKMKIYRPCLYAGCPSLVERGYCEKHRNRKRYCAAGGCPEIVQGKAYCDKHDPKLKKNRNPEKVRESYRKHDRKRGSASERGYDAKWNRLSKAYLGKHPLCEHCEKRGILRTASLVHHVKPLRQGGERLNTNNLVALCRQCHEAEHKRLDKGIKLPLLKDDNRETPGGFA